MPLCEFRETCGAALFYSLPHLLSGLSSHLGSPRLGSPRLVSPRLVSPRLALCFASVAVVLCHGGGEGSAGLRRRPLFISSKLQTNYFINQAFPLSQTQRIDFVCRGGGEGPAVSRRRQAGGRAPLRGPIIYIYIYIYNTYIHTYTTY